MSKTRRLRTGLLASAALAIVTAACLTAAVAVGDGRASAGHGPCFTASEASTGGPAAPSKADARATLGAGDSIRIEVTWQDNATDETCYVVERSLPSASRGLGFYAFFIAPWQFSSVVLPPGTTRYEDPETYLGAVGVFYRVYAATGTKRSAYAQAFGYMPIAGLRATPTPMPPPTLAQQLVPCANAVRSVWEHDNERQEWRTFVPGAPAGVNTFTGPLRAGEPYWLFLDRECELPTSAQRLQLNAGGNLVVWR